MRDRAIIFGDQVFAETIRLDLDMAGIQICAFCVDEAYRHRDSVGGLPLVSFETVQDSYPPDQFDAYVGVGYSRMGEIRLDAMRRLAEKGYDLPNFIAPTATVLPGPAMGRGNLILPRAFIGREVSIGSGNVILPMAHIAHNNVLGDGNFISTSAMICGFAQVSNNCFIGANSCVRDKIRLAPYTLVGGHAYIDRDTRPHGAYAAPRAVELAKDSLDVAL